MKVKLLKIDYSNHNLRYGERGTAFYFSKSDEDDIILDMTDWEEVSIEEYYLLLNFVRDNKEYVIVSYPEEKQIVKLSIQAMLEKQKEDQRKKEIQNKKNKAKALKIQETKKANRLKKLKEELAKLEKNES
jgi:hypothetical protein